MTQQEYDNLSQEEKTQHLLGNNQSNGEWEQDLERASNLTRSQLLRELGESR
jgi:hypothetical protein